MKSIAEHNRERRAVFAAIKNNKTGVACLVCGVEMERDDNSVLLSFPPRISVHCSACGYQTNILA